MTVVPFPADGFLPVTDTSVRQVTEGTIADLRMESGRVYRARWGTVPGWLSDTPATCTAWWPIAGRRKRPVGLFDPVAFRIVRTS